ncbi:unnamed protein product, partial [Didymodactylos carnosus]
EPLTPLELPQQQFLQDGQCASGDRESGDMEQVDSEHLAQPTPLLVNKHCATGLVSTGKKIEKLILTTKFKKPRTTKQQKRRNRKGSLSYRKKNYAICVIRQVDPRFTAPECREILLGMGIQPRKTKIQGGMLHLGMYNNEQQLGMYQYQSLLEILYNTIGYPIIFGSNNIGHPIC